MFITYSDFIKNLDTYVDMKYSVFVLTLEFLKIHKNIGV